MSWIKLTNLDFTQGSDVVASNENIDLHTVKSNWALYLDDGKLLEVTDGTPYDAGTGKADLILEEAWPDANSTGRAGYIIPTNAPLIDLLKQIEDSEAVIQQVTGQFPTLTGTEQDYALIVDASGNGFEAVDGQDFLFRTGILPRFDEKFAEGAQTYVDQATNRAETAATAAEFSETNAKASEDAAAASAVGVDTLRDEAQRWANESEDIVVENGEFSSYHYSRKSAASAVLSDTHRAASLASANNSAASENMAFLWAQQAENTEVQPGEFSAYHWAKKSGDSASASQASATSSQNSANASEASRQASGASAAAAAASEDNAAASEAAAEASATTAAAAVGLMSESEYRARQAANREKFAGSGFVEWGYGRDDGSYEAVRPGLSANPATGFDNRFFLGTATDTDGVSRTKSPRVNVNGAIVKIAYIGSTSQQALPKLPQAPTASVEASTTTTQDYSQGDFVVTGNDIYICIADSTSGTLLTNTSFFESRPAVSRQDLVFLEVWEELLSDKGVAYLYGNVQNGVSSWKGISLDNTAVVATYSAFGAWETSPVAGYGLRWSTATEAQKQTFIDDPENNIFVNAAGELVQARYRIRVVPGLGDEWLNVKPVNTELLVYRESPNRSRIRAWGSSDSSLGDFSNSTGEGFVAHENSLSKTSFIGGFSYFGGPASGYNEKTIFALPIALVQRRNQGAYHPVYNPEGCSEAMNDAGTVSGKWYASGVQDGVTSVARAFSKSRYVVQPASNSGSLSEPGREGRPDLKYFDAIYASDVKDLRKSARRVEDFARTDEREFKKLVAGEQRGFEGVRGVAEVVTATPDSKAHNGTTINVGFPAGSGVFTTQDSTETGLSVAQGGHQLSADGKPNGILIDAVGTPFGLGGYDPEAGGGANTPRVFLLPVYGTNIGQVDITGPCTVILFQKRTHQQETLLHCDIIGDPVNWPAIWTDPAKPGVAGFPLVIGENGGSLLPAEQPPTGLYKVFKLSRKFSSGVEIKSVIAYDGAGYSSVASGVSDGNYNVSPGGNHILFYSTDWVGGGSFDNNTVFMVFYEAPANPLEVASNTAVLNVGDARAFGYNSAVLGREVTGFLTGKISTGASLLNLAASLGATSNFAIGTDSKLVVTGVTKPKHPNPVDDANTPGSKALPYLTHENGVFYLQVLFKELHYHATADGGNNSYNDTGDFTVVDNLSTDTDDNGNTVLAGQKRLELPFLYREDEQ